MLKFNKSTIDKWKAKFQKYPAKQAQLDNRPIDYFILPMKLFKSPSRKQIPNGLFRMTGEPEAGYVIGVSDEVPEDLKDYFALSEHDEFIVYGMQDPDRTLHAEQKIIEIITPELELEYRSNKLTLYNHICQESKGNLEEWGFTQEDYTGFLRAVAFLN